VITCLNKEISDNSFKVSRWVVQALLAEVDLMKFAFVSRREMNDNKKHVVLATHTV
jgi:translation initiation factor 3 subunit D